MIGSHVARELAKRECYTVYGLARRRSNLDTLVGILDKVSLVTGDITDGPRMLATIEEIRPHYIYHFAAQAINGISYDLPELTLDTNVIGTMNILKLYVDQGLRFAEFYSPVLPKSKPNTITMQFVVFTCFFFLPP